jgi:hypothetical protein
VAEQTTKVEFLTEEELLEQDEKALARISDAPKNVLKFTRSTKVTRQEVVNAFTNAFQMIGGVDRLALWADQNPSEFYRLYGKLLPPSNADILDGSREFIVRHVLPKPLIADAQPVVIDGKFTKQ